MESFKNSDGKIVVMNLIKVIQENKEYLSKVDGAIGDGDHGINMNKGFSLCENQIKDEPLDLSKSFITLGTILLTEIGGSMGPLYGSFFRGMGKACRNEVEIDKYVFMKMIEEGYLKITSIGNAKVGDKTLIDTLYPSLESLKKDIEDEKSFKNCLIDMSKAAEKGKDSTVDLVAKIGRSARLGERSKGVLDAGAASCYLIIDSISTSIQLLLK